MSSGFEISELEEVVGILQHSSQQYSVTFTESSLSCYRLVGLELTPGCNCIVSYFMRTTTKDGDIYDADDFGSHESEQNKKEWTNVICLLVTLMGVDNLPELLASRIAIKATKDGVRPLSCKEDHGRVDRDKTRSWIATWKTCCGYQRPACLNCDGTSIKTGSYYEVLVDLGSMRDDPISLIRPGQRNALQNMEKLLADQHLTDVTFKFPDDTELKAHSIVLVTGSPVLAAMFTHDTKERDSRIVEIKDASSKVFQRVLQYLYTGTAKDMERMAEDLFVIADKYQIDSLKEECASFLAKKLTFESATKVLILFHLHNCPELLESTLDFIANKGKAVGLRPEWLECMKNYPELCFQATERMLVGK